MNYFKTTLLLIGVFFTFESNAQSQHSFTVTVDSLEIDIYNNYDADTPPINLNKLQEPTLFILNNQEMKVSGFSELNLEDKKIESITIIQDQQELQKSGYGDYNSVVRVRTELKE